MVLKTRLKENKFQHLIDLFETSGDKTRLRLARHVLEREGASLETLLSIFNLVSRNTWHEYDLYMLKPRLCSYATDPQLFSCLIRDFDRLNDMQLSIVFKVLTVIGNCEIVPSVIPYLSCSTPWVGFPALKLLKALGDDNDWEMVAKRDDWRENTNETIKAEIVRQVELHS